MADDFDPKKHVVENGHGLRKDGQPRKKPGRKKKDVGGELEKLRAEIAALKGAKQAEEQRVMEEAGRDLHLLRPPSPEGDPEVRPTPYRGRVKALQDCYMGQYFKPGDVFPVDVPALWSDDPYVPVDEAGEPITHLYPQASHMLRPKSDAVLAAESKTRPINQY